MEPADGKKSGQEGDRPGTAAESFITPTRWERKADQYLPAAPRLPPAVDDRGGRAGDVCLRLTRPRRRLCPRRRKRQAMARGTATSQATGAVRGPPEEHGWAGRWAARER